LGFIQRQKFTKSNLVRLLKFIASQRNIPSGRTIHGRPASRRRIRTEQPQATDLATFKDSSAIYDANFFPKDDEKFYRRLNPKRPFLLKCSKKKLICNMAWLF